MRFECHGLRKTFPATGRAFSCLSAQAEKATTAGDDADEEEDNKMIITVRLISANSAGHLELRGLLLLDVLSVSSLK